MKEAKEEEINEERQKNKLFSHPLVHAPPDLEEVRDRVLGCAHQNAMTQVHHVPGPNTGVRRGSHGLDDAALDGLAGPEEDARVHVALHGDGSPALLKARANAGDGVAEVDAVVDGDDVRARRGHALHEAAGAADVEDDLEVRVAV